MASVLVIATDRMIGGLLGQLADLTGHAAQFRGDGETLDDAIRYSRADVVMLDAAFGGRAMDLAAVLTAECGAALVYFGAGIPAAELRRVATERGAKYFALPAGPRLLARILSSALAEHGTERQVDASGAGYSAVIRACAAVSRARAIADRSESVRAASRALRSQHEAMVAECRRLRGTLREAVIAYTRQLRGDGMPPDRALEQVKSALRAQSVGPDLPTDLDDAVEWCLQAYYAA